MSGVRGEGGRSSAFGSAGEEAGAGAGIVCFRSVTSIKSRIKKKKKAFDGSGWASGHVLGNAAT